MAKLLPSGALMLTRDHDINTWKAALNHAALAAADLDRGNWCESAEEETFHQGRLSAQPRDFTVCQFRLSGKQLGGNVVALLTPRAAPLPRAAQGTLRE